MPIGETPPSTFSCVPTKDSEPIIITDLWAILPPGKPIQLKATRAVGKRATITHL